MSAINIMPNAAQFQASLKQYVLIYTPDYLPLWLIVAGVLFVGMLLVLALHGFYVTALPHPMESIIKKRNSIFTQKRYVYGIGVMQLYLSYSFSVAGLTISLLLSAHDTALLVNVHEICGYLLLVCWLSFVLINLVGGNGKFYRIDSKNWLQRVLMQTRFYLYGIIKGKIILSSHPKVKFNPLQQMAYLGVMYALVPLLLITGILLQNPMFIPR